MISLKVAVRAAQAGYVFHKSQTREEAQQAASAFIKYFSAISPAAPSTYSAFQAAKLELAWWQARREFAAAESYGLTISKVASLIYNRSHTDLARAGILRAEAMAYRDLRGVQMAARDWSIVEEKLSLSYSVLKMAIRVQLANR